MFILMSRFMGVGYNGDIFWVKILHIILINIT